MDKGQSILGVLGHQEFALESSPAESLAEFLKDKAGDDEDDLEEGEDEDAAHVFEEVD